MGAALGWIITAIGIPMPPPPNSNLGYLAHIRLTLSVLSGAFLIGISFLDLVPEIFSGAVKYAGLFVLAGFLLYALFGQYMPGPIAHKGYNLHRLVGHMYMTLEGIFGVPLDVAATFIILFTIYGAVLDAAMTDTIEGRESQMLEWIAKEWDIKVEFESPPEE